MRLFARCSRSLPPLVLGGREGMALVRARQPPRETGWSGQEYRLCSGTVSSGTLLRCTRLHLPVVLQGFGIPVLEALACGVPTITSNISSMPEVAGDAAELVDPHSTRALADSLHRLLTDDDRCADLRRRGLRRAAEFSWDRTARLTVESYDRTFAEWHQTQ